MILLSFLSARFNRPTNHTTRFEGVDGRTTEPEVYPRPDGTVYLCGEAEKQLPSKEQSISQVTVKESAIQRLRQVAEALSPNLRDSTLEISQACILPVPSDHLPLIGPIKCVPGLYCATGHTWWGTTTTLVLTNCIRLIFLYKKEF